MGSFKAFRKFVKKNRDTILVVGVPAPFPYNYGRNTAYEVTFKGVTKQFFFNSDGYLLLNRLVKKAV